MATTRNPFQKITRKWVDDAFKPPLTDIPPIVYHYTDAAGLQGMLSSHEIWATDSRFLNDREELRHFRSAAKKFIQEKSIETTDQDLADLLSAVVKWQNIETTNSVFIFSLSAKRDDLSQWRGYAREGLGYTIGFNAAELYRLSEPRNADFSFVKVEYLHERQQRALEQSWADVVRELRTQLRRSTAERDALIDQAARSFDHIVEVRAALNKHQSFASEGEWRISSFVERLDVDGDIKVRVSGGKLVPYIQHELRVGRADRLPITCIGIGPGFEGGEHKLAVQTLLRRNSYPVDTIEVYPADTPFRST